MLCAPVPINVAATRGRFPEINGPLFGANFYNESNERRRAEEAPFITRARALSPLNFINRHRD